MKNRSCAKFCFLIPLAVIAFLGVFAFAVYELWNGVLTDVLPVKAITFWQALGLLVLAKILFGGFPHRGGHCGSLREHIMAKRWAHASPEEQEQMREEMRRRFGDWPRPSWCCSDEEKPVDSGKEPGEAKK